MNWTELVLTCTKLEFCDAECYLTDKAAEIIVQNVAGSDLELSSKEYVERPMYATKRIINFVDLQEVTF